jgi:hypothetical protein
MLPAALLVIISAALGVLHSDYFKVRQVVVHSPDAGVADEVRSRLTLVPHPNTVFYPLTQLEAQVLSCPRVLHVDIARELPSRIVVAITERKPRFALRGDRDYVMVDADGVLLFHTAQPPVIYPRVEGAQVGAGPTGGRLSADSVKCVLECEQGAREGHLGLSFTVNLQMRYDLHLLTPSGTDIRLGGPDNLMRKVIAGAAIERHALSMKMPPEYIDVRVPGQESWKPKAPQVAADSRADRAPADESTPSAVRREADKKTDEDVAPARRSAAKEKASEDRRKSDTDSDTPVRKARNKPDEDASAERKKASADEEPKPKARTTPTRRSSASSDREDSKARESERPRSRATSTKSKAGAPKDAR